MPAGLLLLAIHGGEGEVHADDWFGRGVSIEFEYQTTRVYAAGVKR
jgi:hypothetical protein